MIIRSGEIDEVVLKSVRFKFIFDVLTLNRFSNGCLHRTHSLFGFSELALETMHTSFTRFHFWPSAFWVLVSFLLKCTWKLQKYSVGVSVYEDSKFYVSTPNNIPLRVGEVDF